MLLYIYIFLLGTVIGSFLNVLIYRLPRQESIITPPSHCPECGEYLKVRDLIPIFSFLLSRGKCRYCAKAISWQYPVVELLTGFLFILLYFKYGFNTDSIFILFLIMVLVVCSFIDLKYKIIPNKITYPVFFVGLMYSFFFSNNSLLTTLYNIIIPAGFLFLLALIIKNSMGMGDIKYVAMIGSFLGWVNTMSGIFLGSIIGLIISLVLILFNVISRESKIPFAPFISLGIIIVLFCGEKLFHFLYF